MLSQVWICFGGKREAGESPDKTAHREFVEESMDVFGHQFACSLKEKMSKCLKVWNAQAKYVLYVVGVTLDEEISTKFRKALEKTQINAVHPSPSPSPSPSLSPSPSSHRPLSSLLSLSPSHSLSWAQFLLLVVFAKYRTTCLFSAEGFNAYLDHVTTMNLNGEGEEEGEKSEKGKEEVEKGEREGERGQRNEREAGVYIHIGKCQFALSNRESFAISDYFDGLKERGERGERERLLERERESTYKEQRERREKERVKRVRETEQVHEKVQMLLSLPLSSPLSLSPLSIASVLVSGCLQSFFRLRSIDVFLTSAVMAKDGPSKVNGDFPILEMKNFNFESVVRSSEVESEVSLGGF